ncbi:hypothetical protein [Streptomyces sp. SM13]|uniref:hypothetical protein n=1 Tax=Streptomyces sp. SM13 TaxID=1983803 RepID=UPI000CD4D4D0|nr:hypothetical protein [Streptomyces sp. SM13]
MRFRTVAASAALVLCTTVSTVACSSSPETADADRPAGPGAPASVEGLAENIETGKRQAGPPETGGQEATGPAKCATSAAEIPAECAVDVTFSEITEGEQATEPPVR